MSAISRAWNFCKVNILQKFCDFIGSVTWLSFLHRHVHFFQTTPYLKQITHLNDLYILALPRTTFSKVRLSSAMHDMSFQTIAFVGLFTVSFCLDETPHLVSLRHTGWFLQCLQIWIHH
jgi:hypothetical protein